MCRFVMASGLINDQVIDVWSQCKIHDTGEEGRRRGPARVWGSDNNITRITMSSALNVLSTLVLISWCGQSSKGLRGQTSLGVCWVNSQAKVEQVSSNFGCDCTLKHIVPSTASSGPSFGHFKIWVWFWGVWSRTPPPPVWSKTKVMYFFFTFECFPYCLCLIPFITKSERGPNKY